jgi:hypothetical protein
LAIVDWGFGLTIGQSPIQIVNRQPPIANPNLQSATGNLQSID